MLIRQHIPQSCFSLSKKFSRFRNWNHTLSIKINQQQNVYVTCTCSSRSIKHRVPCILKPTLRGISCLEWACCCIATEFPSIIDEFAQICMFGWWWSINKYLYCWQGHRQLQKLHRRLCLKYMLYCWADSKNMGAHEEISFMVPPAPVVYLALLLGGKQKIFWIIQLIWHRSPSDSCIMYTADM